MKKMNTKLCLAALMVALLAGSADARKHTRIGSGGGTPTNYGCTTLLGGTVLRSADHLSSTTVPTNTWSCYLCNMTTRVCTLQSPSSLYGWTFVMP